MKINTQKLISDITPDDPSILMVLVDHLSYSINDINSYDELTESEKSIITKEFFDKYVIKSSTKSVKFEFRQDTTIGELFDHALKLAKEGDNDACREFFNDYVNNIVEDAGVSIEEATNIAKGNLGYYAGYYGDDTRLLIEKTYAAEHPIFGSANNPISPEEAFELGRKMAL